jgi:hypothetical protein
MNSSTTLLQRPTQSGFDRFPLNSTTARSTIDPAHQQPMFAEAAELEEAMAEYKRRSGRQFPTWSEVLEVLRGLGYAKPEPRDPTSPTADLASSRPRLQIRRDCLGAQAIDAILTRHGGVCVDSGASRIYEFPSRSACDAALVAVRSAYGWTSIEPRY